MRYFNTSGPCDPDKHYTVMRQDLIAKGEQMVAEGRYLTIFAPRQAGKTTYFQLLLQRLEQQVLPIWVNFEALTTLSRPDFYKAISRRLERAFKACDIHLNLHIQNQDDLQYLFEDLDKQIPGVVLVIDEFEGIPSDVLGELMHAFRELYHQKDFHHLQSLILVGVSTIAELVVSTASPFNVVDVLELSYFTPAEVADLIGQYEAETGQPFEQAVIEAIYTNTQGQPGLVCALCRHLVEEVVTDRTQPVAMSHFYITLKHFLTERFDKNILNIVRKAREKQAFMLKLLFGEQAVPFTVNHPDIAYLYANGVIGEANGYVAVTVPLYKKCLITAFRPLINGEAQHYITSAQETLAEYVTPQGLNLNALLEKYRAYVQRRGFKAFDTKHLLEGAWHYSLDGFIHFFIERLGGETFIEVPTGRGRTDILIFFEGHKYVIETKIFTDRTYFERGKTQLATYLKSEGLNEGFYVVFSNKHQETDPLYFEDEIDGRRIYTYVIRTNFERAT